MSFNPLFQPIINASQITSDIFNSVQPVIRKTNSYNVFYNLKSLKHNQDFKLEPLYAKYNDINEGKGFQIDYKLIVSNVPNLIEGQLNVRFEN